MNHWIDIVTSGFGEIQQALFEAIVQPALMKLGMASLVEDAFDATAWLMIGLVQIAILLLIAGFERWRPVEAVTDPAAVRVDVFYTLIHRLGIVSVLIFFLLQPVWDHVHAWARLNGWMNWELDALVAPAWPGITDTAWFSFLLYLVVFDLVDYLIHRGQHRFSWWWSLHAVHHSQRQLTVWSDDRNHLIDDAIRATIIALVAGFIGVAPGQFLLLVAVTNLLQSLSHANLRIGFGALGERLVVSPHFHRLHHAEKPPVEPGPSGSTPASCNYAALFPVWDLLFGTACMQRVYLKTGIAGPDTGEPAEDYGRGFWSQQWLAIPRLLRSLVAPWRPADGPAPVKSNPSGSK